jgi:energy-coupling factor transporter ATP-binding protein EcfA2
MVTTFTVLTVGAVPAGAVGFRFPPGQSAEQLVEQLRANQWRGQVLGPHGSGKSTLLAALLPAMERAGQRPLVVELHDGQRGPDGSFVFRLVLFYRYAGQAEDRVHQRVDRTLGKCKQEDQRADDSTRRTSRDFVQANYIQLHRESRARSRALFSVFARLRFTQIGLDQAREGSPFSSASPCVMRT